MKIAEALARRKDIQEVITDLSLRIAGSATVQQGDTADEQPDALIEMARPLLAERAALTHRIFVANLHATFIFQGTVYTISEALAEMERLKALHMLWKTGVENASTYARRRFSRDDVLQQRVVDTARWRVARDETAKTMRELDLALQMANWTLDVDQPVSETPGVPA